MAYFLMGSLGSAWLAPVRNAVPLIALVTFVLILPALGVALVKPSVVGTTARASSENVRSLGYSIYYTLVNVGSMLGPLLAGWQEEHGAIVNVFRIASVSVLAMLFVVLLLFKEPRRLNDAAPPDLAQVGKNFVMELAVAAVSPGWKWLYITIGIISIIAGIVALVWPGETFLVLAAIIGWLLLFYGIVDVVVSIGTRHIQDLWWLQLIVGIAMMLLGLWAIAPDNQTVSTWRGTVLLVFWVGIAALMRGISDIIVGFRVRSAHKALTKLAA